MSNVDRDASMPRQYSIFEVSGIEKKIEEVHRVCSCTSMYRKLANFKRARVWRRKLMILYAIYIIVHLTWLLIRRRQYMYILLA